MLVATHSDISCNECKMSPLRGIRYACPQCDYDLCEICFRGVFSHNHDLMAYKSARSDLCRVTKKLKEDSKPVFCFGLGPTNTFDFSKDFVPVCKTEADARKEPNSSTRSKPMFVFGGPSHATPDHSFSHTEKDEIMLKGDPDKPLGTTVSF